MDEDGLLHIVAKEEFFSGPVLQDDDPGYPGPDVTRNYTSARLRTRNKADWMYGRVEVRAQGPGDRVDELLASVRTGPPGARVDSIEAHESEKDLRFDTFTIR